MALSVFQLEAGWSLLFDSWLGELALGFTFFTALSYSVLIGRFDHPRPVAAMAATIGLALGSGLAAWARMGGWSVVDLGPAAAGISLLAIVVVVYQAFARLAGHIVAAMASLMTSLLILSLVSPLVPVVRQLAALVLLLGMLGAFAWVVFRLGDDMREVSPALSPAQVQGDLSEIHELQSRTREMGRQIDELRSNSAWLREQPTLAVHVRKRLDQMLPEQGKLTERLSHLREMMHRTRQGEAAQVKALEKLIRQLSPDDRAQAVRQLKDRCQAWDLTRRLERLDRAVAEAERRLTELTRGVDRALHERRFDDVNKLMDAASKLQHQMQQLIIRIERTEQKLLEIVRAIAQDGGGR